jgi:hypothetical protein
MAKITVKNTEIAFYKKEQEDYISLTDIAKTRDAKNPSQIISLWMRTYSTIEYLGLWENAPFDRKMGAFFCALFSAFCQYGKKV